MFGLYLWIIGIPCRDVDVVESIRQYCDSILNDQQQYFPVIYHFYSICAHKLSNVTKNNASLKIFNEF